jgi:hypothetical protein
MLDSELLVGLVKAIDAGDTEKVFWTSPLPSIALVILPRFRHTFPYSVY